MHIVGANISRGKLLGGGTEYWLLDPMVNPSPRDEWYRFRAVGFFSDRQLTGLMRHAPSSGAKNPRQPRANLLEARVDGQRGAIFFDEPSKAIEIDLSGAEFSGSDKNLALLDDGSTLEMRRVSVFDDVFLTGPRGSTKWDRDCEVAANTLQRRYIEPVTRWERARWKKMILLHAQRPVHSCGAQQHVVGAWGYLVSPPLHDGTILVNGLLHDSSVVFRLRLQDGSVGGEQGRVRAVDIDDVQALKFQMLELHAPKDGAEDYAPLLEALDRAILDQFMLAPSVR